MGIAALVIVFVVSYFFGAVPWGLIIGKFHGLDIREHGSKNIGATNVTRILGKRWGVLCFAIDFLKGFLPVMAVNVFFPEVIAHLESTAVIFAVLGTVIGHMFPVYLKFKGGKGVSTGAGALFAVNPYVLACGLIIWLIIFKITKFVSLASIIAAASVAVLTFVFSRSGIYPLEPKLEYFILIIALVAIYKHKSNIKRLINGTENSFKR
ncbi:MAG: glycerol-3-phosphate 1-O-acyltransferase PlsY [Victivallales bacterium]|nr:glycerol-3-phosphate 1-O-acyltransferase PlsY [Victivallales bacterium]